MKLRRSSCPEIGAKELTLERILGDTYLDVSEDELVDRALDALRQQGLDPEVLGLTRDVLSALIAARRAAAPTGPEELPVRPQSHRQAQRARLDDEIRSVAARICGALGQAAGGRKIALHTGTGRTDNLSATIVLLNRGAREHLGVSNGQRGELSLEELESVRDNLDRIADTVQTMIAERIR